MYKKLEKQKIKICFVSLNSYPLLKDNVGENYRYVGGAEIQQLQIAKELKKRGYEISFITYGEKNNEVQSRNANGIDILPAYNRNQIENISFFRKIFHIWRKMKEIDADIYYHRAGSTGIIGFFCRLNKKKVIIHLASDADVTGEMIINKNTVIALLNKIGNWLDIRLSDIIISQSHFQKSKLKERFNLNSTIIKNSLDISLQSSKKSFGEYLLWVGTIRSVKQPELFLKIAEYLPENNFLMIGGEGESLELFKKIKNAAEKIRNVEFKGFVPPQKIYSYYQKATMLINTSKTEGFPNIFLEAWSCSIPVVSLNVDPDGIISKNKLGFHSKTFNQMLDNIKTLLKEKKLVMQMGENGRKYVEENHDIKKIVDQYEELIENLLKNRRGKFFTNI